MKQRGYFVGWHPRYGMVIRAQSASVPPALAEFRDSSLSPRLAEECVKVVYLATDGWVYVMKDTTGNGTADVVPVVDLVAMMQGVTDAE